MIFKTRAPLLFILVLAACARVKPPGGGPEDVIPPELVSVSPPPGVGYPELKVIEMEWSERLDPASVSVSLYPLVDREVKVSGSTLAIELEDPLGSRTMVLNISAQLMDRRGNSITSPVDLVYTGMDSLGSGLITLALQRQGGGTLSEGTVVELFEQVSPDSASLPIRRTEADTSGAAQLRWLDEGEYFLRSYEHLDYSLTWEQTIEAGADTSLLLAGMDSLHLDMILTVVDTTGPVIIDAYPEDRNHLVVEVTEELSLEGMGDASLIVTDSSGSRLDIYGFWTTSRRTGDRLFLTTSALSDSRMMLKILGLVDLVGNVTEADSIEFFGTDSLPDDTLSIRSVLPEPGGLDVSPEGPYRISFSHWVNPDSLVSHIRLVHVAPDTVVPIDLRQIDGRSFEISLSRVLLGEQQYRIGLDSGLVSVWGDTLPGYSWTFITKWSDEPGSISGTIIGTQRDIVLQVSRAGDVSQIDYFQVQPGAYQIDDLPAGRYTVAGFIDYDSDGTWDPQEAYGAYPGLVMVYPGMVSEGIDVSILP